MVVTLLLYVKFFFKLHKCLLAEAHKTGHGNFRCDRRPLAVAACHTSAGT